LKTILQIRTRPEDGLADQARWGVNAKIYPVSRGERRKDLLRFTGRKATDFGQDEQDLQDGDVKVETIDLGAGQTDYDALLEAIFRADSIQVW
jgi:hypothetical protein